MTTEQLELGFMEEFEEELNSTSNTFEHNTFETTRVEILTKNGIKDERLIDFEICEAWMEIGYRAENLLRADAKRVLTEGTSYKPKIPKEDVLQAFKIAQEVLEKIGGQRADNGRPLGSIAEEVLYKKIEFEKKQVGGYKQNITQTKISFLT